MELGFLSACHCSFFFGDSPVKYIAQPNSHLQIPKILFECVSFKSRAIYGPPFCSVFSIFMKTFFLCVCVLKIEPAGVLF